MTKSIQLWAAGALLAVCSIASASTDWPHYGGDAGGSKYSPLSQINTENVSKLSRAWVHHSQDFSHGKAGETKTTYEATPLKVDDKLFVCTPFNRVFSLDPGTGEENWVFDPEIDKSITLEGALKCRGVAYWEENSRQTKKCSKRVFSGAIDGRLFALDSETGEPCDDFGQGGFVQINDIPNPGRSRLDLISAPAIYKNLVIVGSSIGDNSFADMVNGRIYAFNAISGELEWAFDPIPEDMQDKVGAANTWAAISVDEERELVFIGTGSASPDYYGGKRKEPIPYANATIALDANSGKPAWHYQTVHHDIWDYDIPSQPTLVNLTVNGEKKPVVLQTTKTGFIFVFDRDTGEPYFKINEVPVPQSDVPGEQTALTQPIPTLPKPFARQSMSADEAWGLVLVDKWGCKKQIDALRNEGIFTPVSIGGSLQFPSFAGGNNWGGLAFDPQSNIAIVNAMNVAAKIELIPTQEVDTPKEKESHMDAGYELEPTQDSPYSMKRGIIMSMFGAPCTPPPWGTLNAINIETGEIVWQVPFGRVKKGPFKTLASWGAPNIGGPIVTAGGLIFIGATLDNEFHAYDIQTGKQLWHDNIPAPANATPLTYEHQGKQYVVVAAGGHGVFNTDLSDALIAYTLNGDQ